MFKKAKEISDDKVNIAVHTYELVDKHIRKLDSDLAKFESEMKVSGCSRLQGHASFASNSLATNFSYLVTKEDGGSGAFIISLHRVLQRSQHPGGRLANQ